MNIWLFIIIAYYEYSYYELIFKSFFFEDSDI